MTPTPVYSISDKPSRLAILISLLLAACGGGGSDPAPANSVLTLVRIQSEAPGPNCSAGGSIVRAGIDIDGDGSLSPSEATTVQYVCNGAPGAAGAAGGTGNDGFSTLVLMSAEPAGSNCAAGGKRLDAGKDSNRNGVLDAVEVSSTSYVCNGTNGRGGVDALSTLVVMTSEAPGANCTYGGSKVASGLDTNASAALDPSEITSTSYLCNGAPGATGSTGATGPAGPGLNWGTVSGTTVLAQANTGYLASSASQVVVTLPTTPAVGDVIRVSGVGSGGWKVALQAGQSVITAGVATTTTGAIWRARESPRDWSAVASSADGRKLLAAEYGGQLYTSDDSGLTWTARDSGRNWQALASSANGTKLAAAVFNGQIYTSTDSGLSWTPHESNRVWIAIASSADGTKLVAAETLGQLYTSTDSGLTWTARDSSRNWYAVASSADGTKLVAANQGGQLYTSIDSGLTWTARDSSRNWFVVASSADGTKLAAADSGGAIYTSIDSGLTWTPRESGRPWYGIASSADGGRLVAIEQGGKIFTSVDSGLTWTPHDDSRSWSGVASSADGTKLVAVELGNKIYTSIASTSLGTAGFISGSQYDAVELQYVGNGTFIVLTYVGSLEVQ